MSLSEEPDIGDSKIMIAEENKQWGNLSPRTIGGSPVTLCLIEDVSYQEMQKRNDAMFK